MKHIVYWIFIATSFCGSAALAQGGKLNLVHLTKEEYSRQIEEGFEAAYADAHKEGQFKDVEVDSVTYDGYAYEWMIEIINKTIDEHFSVRITHNAMAEAGLTYRMTCHRDKKSIYIQVSFHTKDRPQGAVDILSGLMKLDGVSGIVRINAAKKNLYKVLEPIAAQAY
jgi:hypothetical protein